MGECIIFDFGCYLVEERVVFKVIIEKQELMLVCLINIYCYIDYVFGNQFVMDIYGLELEMYEGEVFVLNVVFQFVFMFGFFLFFGNFVGEFGWFIDVGVVIIFGNIFFKVLFMFGYFLVSFLFFCESDCFLIVGDVFFMGSIGCIDLLGGDFDILIWSIQNELFLFGDDVIVYFGYGLEINIGYEK